MSNRRTFLQTAGGAVVYKLAAAAPQQQRAVSANDQIAFGFIGSGVRGSQLLDEFKQISAVRPVAVCDLYDRCLERAKEQTDGAVTTTKDYHEVLKRKDIDAVVIASPDHWHKRMVLDALASGKHVYIEKPISWSIEDGKEMVDATAKTKLVLQVGSQGKTSPLAAKARDLIKSGAIGKVNMVRMADHRNNPEGAWVYPIPPDASTETIDWDRFIGSSPKKAFDPKIFFRWRCWWEYSGGVATDLYVHLLTWLHEVMDVPAPKSVVSQGGIYRWNDGRTVPDIMNSIFEYDGFVADMYVNLTNAYGSRGIYIMGSEGTLVNDQGRFTIHPDRILPDVQAYGTLSWPKAMRAAYFESHGYTAEGRPKSPLPEAKKPQEITVGRGPSHYELFVTSIRDGKPSRETATEGHYAASAAHLANMAYRKGHRMSWDHRTGKVKEG